MSATYDITTTRGQARFHAADTNMSSAVWNDAEVDYLLDLTGDNALLAAAMLLESAATDTAKIAVITKNDNQTTDPSKMPELIAARARVLREQAAGLTSGLTAVADRVAIFEPQENDTDTLGNLEPW